MGRRIIVLAVTLSVITVQNVFCQVPVRILEACQKCCTDMDDMFDSENAFDVIACQQVCDINADCDGISDDFQRAGCQKGLNFRDFGVTKFPEGNIDEPQTKFFCSRGGQLTSIVFTDENFESLQNNLDQCALCCNEMNARFDAIRDAADGQLNSDQYSVAACRARCRGLSVRQLAANGVGANIVNANGNCVQDPENDINGGFFFKGCIFGQELLRKGTIQFEGIDHHCSRGSSVPVGAALAELPNQNQNNGNVFNPGVFTLFNNIQNDCAKCCLELDTELDIDGTYDRRACGDNGCNANRDCALVFQIDIENGVGNAEQRFLGCKLGKQLLNPGNLEFEGRNINCVAGGKIVGNVEQVLKENNNKAGLIAGSVLGSILGVATLYFVGSRIKKHKDEKDTNKKKEINYRDSFPSPFEGAPQTYSNHPFQRLSAFFGFGRQNSQPQYIEQGSQFVSRFGSNGGGYGSQESFGIPPPHAGMSQGHAGMREITNPRYAGAGTPTRLYSK